MIGIIVVDDDRPIQFIGTRKHPDGRTRNQYHLICSTCGTEGELGVMPNKAELIRCPGYCGTLFIQIPPSGMFDHPRLVEVTAGSVEKSKKETN